MDLLMNFRFFKKNSLGVYFLILEDEFDEGEGSLSIFSFPQEAICCCLEKLLKLFKVDIKEEPEPPSRAYTNWDKLYKLALKPFEGKNIIYQTVDFHLYTEPLDTDFRECGDNVKIIPINHFYDAILIHKVNPKCISEKINFMRDRHFQLTVLEKTDTKLLSELDDYSTPDEKIRGFFDDIEAIFDGIGSGLFLLSKSLEYMKETIKSTINYLTNDPNLANEFFKEIQLDSSQFPNGYLSVQFFTDIDNKIKFKETEMPDYGFYAPDA